MPVKHYKVYIEIDGRRIGWIKVDAESQDHAAGQALAAWRRYYGGLWPKDQMKVEKFEVITPDGEVRDG